MKLKSLGLVVVGVVMAGVINIAPVWADDGAVLQPSDTVNNDANGMTTNDNTDNSSTMNGNNNNDTTNNQVTPDTATGDDDY